MFGGEGLKEALLVVVEAVPLRVVLTANVHNNVEGLQDLWVPGPHNLGSAKLLGLPEKKACLQKNEGEERIGNTAENRIVKGYQTRASSAWNLIRKDRGVKS